MIYSKPITLIINKITNNVSVSSSYWLDDYGEINNEEIIFNILGKCNINENYIKFNDNNYWHKDLRKNLLFIGANDMQEINYYVNNYKNGLFIEAIDYTYERLKKNLSNTIIYNTNYIAINDLVSSKKNIEYIFNIFNNSEGSSSIYEPNIEKWEWPDVIIKEKKKLISNTIEDILKKNNWEEYIYDVVLDVQGAELEVLKGFGINNLKNIKTLTVEISSEKFYIGGVLFNELNDYLINNNFILYSNPISSHCDVIYTSTIL